MSRDACKGRDVLLLALHWMEGDRIECRIVNPEASSGQVSNIERLCGVRRASATRGVAAKRF